MVGFLFGDIWQFKVSWRPLATVGDDGILTTVLES